jgi:hypothetical protein
MLLCCRPPLDACLQQGAEGGVDITARRFERSVMLSPPCTAHPADLSGQLQSR